MIVPIALAAAFLGGARESVVQRELLSTVTIIGDCARDCSRGNTVFGAGEIVSRRADGELVVLTARHVVAAMSRPCVYLRDAARPVERLESYRRNESARFASVIATSAGADLALIRFRPAPGDRYDVAPLSAGAPPQAGNVIGHPYGSGWTVSSFRFIDAMRDAFIVRCSTCGPGDSGGGVFDSRGGLGGILVSEERIVMGNEPPAFARRTERFAVVPMGQVRSLLAFQPRDVVAAHPASNPWTRFKAVAPVRDTDPWSPVAWKKARRSDPWLRFPGSSPGAHP